MIFASQFKVGELMKVVLTSMRMIANFVRQLQSRGYLYYVLNFYHKCLCTLKSIEPLLPESNVLKTFSQNFSASPAGKNLLYISQKVVGVSFPLGHSWDRIDLNFSSIKIES